MEFLHCCKKARLLISGRLSVARGARGAFAPQEMRKYEQAGRFCVRAAAR